MPVLLIYELLYELLLVEVGDVSMVRRVGVMVDHHRRWRNRFRVKMLDRSWIIRRV